MSRATKQAIDELEQLASHSAIAFQGALVRMARATFQQDPRAHELALSDLATTFWQTQTLANLLGRRRLIFEAKAVEGRQPAGEPAILFDEDETPLAPEASGIGEARAGLPRGDRETPVMPRVPFEEAVEDLVSRWPVLVDRESEVPPWQQIAKHYQTKHAFGLARSSDIEVTRKVQEAIQRAIARGEERFRTEDLIQAIGGWTRAYAETVYRTNLNTAFTQGRFQQAREPSVTGIIGAFEYNAILDSTARPNHAANHGLIASQFDPVWDTHAPPQGFNCRCSLRLVDRYTLRQLGLIRGNRVARREPARFFQAHPDPGFEVSRARIETIFG